MLSWMSRYDEAAPVAAVSLTPFVADIVFNLVAASFFSVSFLVCFVLLCLDNMLLALIPSTSFSKKMHCYGTHSFCLAAAGKMGAQEQR